jgi:hypothetical protein
MTQDEINEALALLREVGPQCIETYHVTEFEGHRRSKGGESQNLTIRITDCGPDKNEKRYHCTVIADGEKMAFGNPAATIKDVLLHVRWRDLD